MMYPQHSLGIDIGGTFTDFALWLADERRFVTMKVPTTRARPAAGVISGLERLATEHNVQPSDIGYFVHGTTIALNTLIERDGARLGMLVTRGFRDLLVIQRLRMPTPYHWRTGRPEPLLPRRHVFEITERLGPDGEIETDFVDADVDVAIDAARAAGLDGLVVCFMHAYRNPVHEQRARDWIGAKAPDLFVCCSHEIWPRMREYERALISIMNAYVMPKVDGYLGDLQTRLESVGLDATPFITQSAGGIVTAASARRFPVETLLSGPAAGVMGAVEAARLVGVGDFVTLDIGGTSADVAFVDGGVPRISQSEHVADFPLLMPVIGVSSIGAGGGSIITVDEMGVMRVGPTSVGADPGPVCYGKGGTVPAVTDAFLVGGFLNPRTFAGGRLDISVDAARRALVSLSGRLGRDEAGTVEAVIQVAVSSIYAELSNLAAKQGVSVRDYALLPFGGAGPLLAAPVAEELGIRRIIVPANPGTLCSLGALLSDVSKPFVRSIVLPLAEARGVLADALRDLRDRATTWLASESPGLAGHRFDVAADMRYIGQSYEIDVAVEPDWLTSGDLASISAAFHQRHRAMFAHADAAAPVEIVDLRLTIAGATEKPFAGGGSKIEAKAAARDTTRPLVVGGRFVPVPVLSRQAMAIGTSIAGPAIVEQDDTTIYVAPGWNALAHESGTLIMERPAQ
ncbi:hydantoinase/oxoprolinase family protein [Limobrevibacterium gyesilva]|uniref:Hydantoinase/oxoprolinase family protein n=1 Tax=Limobrevibacterium gyesilva TaxID=2991712 RepID=A0AA41YMV6_9PROT|nr:hydantoinase/oxoprolinase family protein [Limobrevibacterium gyesilva]MCW3474943.1 hydantoinase/oxoprolinase family protein [Limobrevibacterium gyesilva]